MSTTLIEIPEWETVTLIEAIWMSSGMIALFLTALRMPPLVRDSRNARELHERDLYVIARGYLRRELIRMTQALCVISIGVYAAVEPSAVPGPARISIVGLVITGVLIAISLLVALQSYLDWRDREEVRRIVGGI